MLLSRCNSSKAQGACHPFCQWQAANRRQKAGQMRSLREMSKQLAIDSLNCLFKSHTMSVPVKEE